MANSLCPDSTFARIFDVTQWRETSFLMCTQFHQICSELAVVNLRDNVTRVQTYFTASSLKDIFESVDSQNIIGFINYAHVLPCSSDDEKAVCPSVVPSVCPSVKRVDSDKRKKNLSRFFIPYERSFSLVSWDEEWLVLGDPFCRKFWVKVTALEWNRRFSIYFRS